MNEIDKAYYAQMEANLEYCKEQYEEYCKEQY